MFKIFLKDIEKILLQRALIKTELKKAPARICARVCQLLKEIKI